MLKPMITGFILSMLMLQSGFVYAQVTEPAETTQNVEFNRTYWISPPVIKLTTETDEQKFIKLKLNVNKQGDIVKIAVVQSSGDKLIDKQVVHQFRRAKLKPFMINGEPVAGIIFIPIKIK